MTRRNRPPAPMFAADHDDLPLFSGTPIAVEEKPWNPQPRPEPEAPTADMFAEPPAPCQHLGDKKIAEVGYLGDRFYVATCQACHARGPRRKTSRGAKTALEREA